MYRFPISIHILNVSVSNIAEKKNDDFDAYIYIYILPLMYFSCFDLIEKITFIPNSLFLCVVLCVNEMRVDTL